jgi:hypothetical protein
MATYIIIFALGTLTGITIHQLYSEWKKDVKKEEDNQLYRLVRDEDGNITRQRC